MQPNIYKIIGKSEEKFGSMFGKITKQSQKVLKTFCKVCEKHLAARKY